MNPDLLLSVVTDKEVYQSGEPVRMKVQIANESDEAITLQFSSGQRYEFTIQNDRDREIWRWSEDRGFIQMLGEERLASRGALVYRAEFHGRLEPGSYRVTGTLTLLDQPLSASVHFDIEP